jgi:ABC-type multidrug transport system ATPase subunit
MNGKADFYGPVPRVFSFSGSQGPVVQMNASASFIRSMAGLDLYLRTVPNPDIIVIDEPEMNAHPEAQIKLVELFALLANQGRHVIITTHSPYFIDHLNNLMEGCKLPDDKKSEMAQYTKLGDAGAFISEDKVAVYLFGEDGNVQSLVNDNAIDLESFATETDYLSDLYSRIVCAGNAPHGS